MFKTNVWGRKYDSPGDRWVATVLIPAYYAVFIALGIVGYAFGVPALIDTYGKTFSDVFSYWQFGMGLLGLIGYTFPRLGFAFVELIFSSGLGGQISLYIFLLLFYTATGDEGRGYVGVMCFFGLLAVLVRQAYLLKEIRIYRFLRERAGKGK